MVGAQPTLGGELLVGAAGQVGSGFLLGDFGLARSARELVFGLHQEPGLCFLSRLRPEAHEMPAALEPRAVERECEMTFGETLMGIAVRQPAAAVPDDHRSSAIFAFRDVAFEIEIFERMVLGANREPLLAEREA